MKLSYVFKERAPIFIELAWRISLSSASRFLAYDYWPRKAGLSPQTAQKTVKS